MNFLSKGQQQLKSSAILKAIIFGLIAIMYVACGVKSDLSNPINEVAWRSKTIPHYTQQLDGDPVAGFNYIVNGDYLGSGIPFDMMEKKFAGKDTLISRKGVNANLPYYMTAFEAQNGVTVVNGNCFACHAGGLMGDTIFGLGNSLSDFRQSMAFGAKVLNTGVRLKNSKKTDEWEAFETFGKVYKKMTPYIQTNNPGVNPAARLAEACVMHRNPEDLTFREIPNFEMDEYTLATDVPALWNVKKKNALYYTAVGRGDFTKLLFQASFIGIQDSTEARKAVTNFKDVLAWINSLEPPKYPFDVDENLAKSGKKLFESHCSKCHGTYGEDESYPNKVIALPAIKTDPHYATYAMEANVVEWYNSSWFANSYPKSWHEPQPGYIAPPLDGVWATAPYFHNASVPTIEGVLDSSKRPIYWQRSPESDTYDFEAIGWKYRDRTNSKFSYTYDTTLPGYSNSGHYYGDELDDTERKAVIEYLKTL